MKRFPFFYSVFFSLCLLVFTVYALLDTFVITRVYATVEPLAAEATADSAARTLSAERPGDRGRGRKSRSAEESSSIWIASFRWQRSSWPFSILIMEALRWFSRSRMSRVP